MTQRDNFRVHKGFLVGGPTRDGLRVSRDQQREVATFDPPKAEVFQDTPIDDEEPDGQGDVVARYPAGYHVATEGDEIVVYRRAPNHKTDIFEFDTTQDSGPRPPRTLFELNRLHANHYGRRRAGR